MARPLRIEFPGAVYHVTSRGNARLPIFEDNQDRRRFLSVLDEAVKRFNWLCHAYCLMGNHYHLLVETIDGNLSAGMRHVNGVFTQAYNRRHNRVGHLLQGRYKSILVDRDNYLLELCRYVVLNPVRADIVKHPGKYGWSSYKASAGLIRKPAFLTVDWILGQFGENRLDAQRAYRQFVLAGLSESSPWENLKAQCILGGKEFIEKIMPMLKEKSQLTEIPKRERFAFRPSLEQLLPVGEQNIKTKRNQAIQAAHIDYGYTLSEIARHLGLHYVTISRIVKPPRPLGRGFPVRKMNILV
jgi:REP element-mobilizing transposase RayT